MKLSNLFVAFSFMFILMSCNKDSETADKLEGEWKLVSDKFNGTEDPTWQNIQADGGEAFLIFESTSKKSGTVTQKRNYRYTSNSYIILTGFEERPASYTIDGDDISVESGGSVDIMTIKTLSEDIFVGEIKIDNGIETGIERVSYIRE